MAGLLDLLGGNRAQMPGSASGGLLQNLLAPEVALPMAAALMGNQGNMQNFGNAFAQGGQAMAQTRDKREAQQRQNRTLEYFRQSAPEFAAMIDAGMPMDQAWQTYTKQRFAQTPQGTDDMREYEFAKQQGYGGSFMDFQIDQRKAGATSITNNMPGAATIGTIPQGFAARQDPATGEWTMAQIPGGPEDTSKKDARAAGQAEVSTRVVTSAAQRAREAASNRNLGHVGQGLAAKMPWTDSAEVSRQVEVLKSAAKIENLSAMRQASPTGGALGNVTVEEANMLAAKSGAIDPSSPNFQRDLDDYELTLLQVVHGPDVGAQIFQQSRQGGGTAPGGSMRDKYGLE